MQPVQAWAQPALLFHIPGDVALAVLPDHQRGRNGRVVLRGHVDPVVALHAGVELARVHELFRNAALRHSRARVRQRPVRRHVIGAAEFLPVDQVVEPMRRADTQLPGVEPQIASGNAAHGADRLIVDDERWLRRGLNGPDEVRAVRIERFSALDGRFTEALDQRFAKLGSVGSRFRHGKQLIHRRPLHRMRLRTGTERTTTPEHPISRTATATTHRSS